MTSFVLLVQGLPYILVSVVEHADINVYAHYYNIEESSRRRTESRIEGSYDSYDGYVVRLDPNLYAKVALQKIVLAEDGVACKDFIRAMRQITETREWDPECQTRQCDNRSVRGNINSWWTVSNLQI
jgi:hypothetical protein